MADLRRQEVYLKFAGVMDGEPHSLPFHHTDEGFAFFSGLIVEDSFPFQNSVNLEFPVTDNERRWRFPPLVAVVELQLESIDFAALFFHSLSRSHCTTFMPPMNASRMRDQKNFNPRPHPV